MIKDLILRARRKERFPLVITWDYLRCMLPQAPDHPCHYDDAITAWCTDIAQHPVYLRQYDRFTFRYTRTVNIRKFDVRNPSLKMTGTYYDNCQSYRYIQGTNDHCVVYFDLGFVDDGDLALFLLTWRGRVVNTIPFPKR